ncbi:hypothetical protein CAOG_08534 [Capsaspora owczarzaki ATCC 30864]|uniref:THO complex subunit 1 n=1 Tax=Capsaspora owczarzaki (strain ATCC 30864) TaxID=595528 RepID=A0A0D2VJY3_CAPO3|nr:hypothetical protein CAOG_08534 [Capsaspora owczarzaki ATCC 30864]KJE90322.1 hypothetical protein CAOG_008534 [Capsaspora owczarzaki ATCC 30864]|eukprot:XP_011270115.1 hypothetical protein CAOG_08534 [Capsaspora owczarzaki ATCC 30864]
MTISFNSERAAIQALLAPVTSPAASPASLVNAIVAHCNAARRSSTALPLLPSYESLRAQPASKTSQAQPTPATPATPAGSTQAQVDPFQAVRQLAMDQAFRDALAAILTKHARTTADALASGGLAVSETATDATVATIGLLLDTALECSRRSVLTSSIPLALLTDALDSLTLDVCDKLFDLVEHRQTDPSWTSTVFSTSAAPPSATPGVPAPTVIRGTFATNLQILQLCNELLRRLSKTQDTVFCGRILTFLCSVFPLSEKSGLNIAGAFNGSSALDFLDEESADEVSSTTEEIHRSFWSLQPFFSNPNSCFTADAWLSVTKAVTTVLSTFASQPLTSSSSDGERSAASSSSSSSSSRSSKSSHHHHHHSSHSSIPAIQSAVAPSAPAHQSDDFFFPKFLTSKRLFQLQLNDSTFRRHMLVQILIIFQYLAVPSKARKTLVLKDDQLKLLFELRDKTMAALRAVPPHGAVFAAAVGQVLESELDWNTWKNESCPPFERAPDSTVIVGHLPIASAADAVSQPNAGSLAQSRKRAHDQVDENSEDPTAARHIAKKLTSDGRVPSSSSSGSGPVRMGQKDLTALWNANDESLASLQGVDRRFIPDPDAFFEEAIEQMDPDAQIDKVYWKIGDELFAWRSLRLLARTRLHLFQLAAALPKADADKSKTDSKPDTSKVVAEFLVQKLRDEKYPPPPPPPPPAVSASAPAATTTSENAGSSATTHAAGSEGSAPMETDTDNTAAPAPTNESTATTTDDTEDEFEKYMRTQREQTESKTEPKAPAPADGEEAAPMQS